jgi:signal transduction histidine kinase
MQQIKSSMKEYSKQEKEVMDVHDLFWSALANRDIDLRFSLCSDNITFIGTGLHERATSKAAYRKINEEGVEQYSNAFKINFLWTQVTVFNNSAWVECEAEWIQEINSVLIKDLLRQTTILTCDQSKWLVVHVHGSSPDYRFIEGQFMSTEKTVQRNKELEHEVFNRTQQLNNSLKELKATQAQLIQSEKMASLGELTAGIAHEIQNPLNFVNNFSEVSRELIDELKNEIPIAIGTNSKTETINEILNDIDANLEKINHHGKRADAIVKGMLQHRSSTGQKEPTDINALADEYLRLSYHGLLAKENSFNAALIPIAIGTDFDDTIGKINIIPQDIGRVLLNLITNAFYATGEKLKAESLKQGQNKYEPLVSIQTKKTNHNIEIKVSDNGNGIPQKVVDKIFQPFFTTKPTGQGTGLGLSLAYDIVKAHDGEINVTTEEGKGSEFIIQLPIV